MAVNPRKRKAVTRETPVESFSEEELADGLLDGILSHSEDESEGSEGEEDDSVVSSDIEGLSEDEEDGDEEEEEVGEDLESDEIPSEGEADIREQLRQLKTTDEPLKKKTSRLTHEQDLFGGADNELEVRSENDLQRNYTVTTDAHGNPRYLYKEIGK